MAVVGCGYWGPNLIRNFNGTTGCQIRTVCDMDPERLSHMQQLYPHIQTTTRLEAVMQDDAVEAVAIATPLRFHYSLARAALDAGKHVFIEKPMARTSAECSDLAERAVARQRTLMVGHTFLYSSPVRRIREIVASGELGNLLYVSAQRLNLGLFQKDSNVAWDLAPHDLAIILYVLDSMPLTVTCHGRAHFVEGIEDITTMVLDFPESIFVVIQNSWLDPNKVRQITFVGDRKMLVYDDIEPNEKIKIYDKRVQIPPHYDSFAEFQYSYHYGDVLSPYIKQIEPLRVECRHFVECIQTGAAPLTDGLNGLAVVRILEAADQSLKAGGGTIAI